MRNLKVEAGSKWRHFKGNLIDVIGVAKHTETLEELVVYMHDNELWVRPISIFLSDEDISGRADNTTNQKYRFEKIED